jgi:DNA polymerase-3 subunit delta'
MWSTIGQPDAVGLLDRAIKRGSLAHAYLFAGPAHVGKAKLALELAQAVNCSKSKPPCGRCTSCVRIAEGKHADVIVIGRSSKAASSGEKLRLKISIEDVREIEHSANLSPYEGNYRVYIIDGAEDLSGEAANCFLKTLEEPPPNVIMVLLTTEPGQLIPTIISRCQKIELKPVSIKEIESVLLTSPGLDENRAKLLALLSGGCIGWAISASADEGFLQKRAEAFSEMAPLFSSTYTERFDYISRLEQDRERIDATLTLWLSWWRDLLLIKCGLDDKIINIDYKSLLQSWAEHLQLTEIRSFIQAIEISADRLKANTNARLVLEVMMLNMPGNKDHSGQITIT